MNKHLPLSAAQADALGRLIQMQCDAFEEAAYSSDLAGTRARRNRAPAVFTAEDLECIESLLPLLKGCSKR